MFVKNISQTVMEAFSFKIVILYAGVSGKAAVNGQYHTGDEACLRGIKKELQSTVEFLGLTEAFHRGSIQDLVCTGRGRAVFVEEQSAVLIGYEETGSDRIHADSCGRKVNRQPLGKVGNCRFCTAVCGDLGERTECIHRGNVQNAAAFFADHIGNKDLCGEKGTQKV